MRDVLVAFGVTFVSELGDKSQLVLIALAASRPRRDVVVGALVGVGVVQVIAVVIGGWLADVGLADWLPIVVAAEFIVLGILAWRSADDADGAPEEVDAVPSRGSPRVVVSVAVLMAVAEMGDRTMFTTAGLAGLGRPWAVLVGAGAALVMLTVVAVSIGAALRERLNLPRVRRVGGVIFVAIGLAVLAVHLSG